MLRIAINGFGRIGRAAFKVALSKLDIEVVAVNDITDAPTLAHLLKHDTIYRAYDREVGVRGSSLVVGKATVPVLSEKEPSQLPWKKLKAGIVLECTGRFTTQEEAQKHLKAGAKRVVLSAPAKSGSMPTYILGVNSKRYQGESVISNASCTTNCLAPIVAVLDGTFGVSKAVMTTIHSYTADQRLHDAPHSDLRRARAAAENIVPTTTGAAIATAEVVPKLRGRFDGLSIRVPVDVVSLSDITCILKKKTTAEEVNDAFHKAIKQKHWKGILDATDEELVSSDFIGNSHSAIVDLLLTRVIDGDLVKVVAWYDNEWGYANRLVELAEMVGKRLQ